MKNPQRGEVWLADLGMVAKTRPCLIFSIPLLDEDRALVGIVPHTTQPRGTRFEVTIPARFLKPGAFDIYRERAQIELFVERTLVCSHCGQTKVRPTLPNFKSSIYDRARYTRASARAVGEV